MGDKDRQTRTPAASRPALTVDELAAGIRYVARHAPTLALALVWAICRAPQLVAEMARVKVQPAEVATLAELDPALDAIVRSSGDALVLRARAWASSPEEAVTTSEGGEG